MGSVDFAWWVYVNFGFLRLLDSHGDLQTSILCDFECNLPQQSDDDSAASCNRDERLNVPQNYSPADELERGKARLPRIGLHVDDAFCQWKW
jgi:hypothetical protein